MEAAFPNEERIATIDLPYLLMHGVLDTRVGFAHGELLWAAVRGRNVLNRHYFIVEAGHRNVPVPSYTGEELPVEYSHPDELPPGLRADLTVYQSRIADFVVDALEQ